MTVQDQTDRSDRKDEPRREPPAGKKSPGRGAIAAGTGLLLLLSKLKTAAFFLLKAGKPLITMVVSVGAYALLYPWTFAIGFVLLIFVHEMGHVWAARKKGIPVSAPFFIPFLGALILLKRNPKDAETEAYIGMGGPILGSVGAFVCYAIGWWSGQEIWYALAYAGFFINLFNLMPVHPLDGGRIAVAISRWLWVAGAVLGPIVIWFYGGVLFFFIWLLFIWQMYKKFFRDRGQGEPYVVEGQYRVPVDPGLPSWYAGGESHSRELPFTAYCRMDGVHVAQFWWEPMSFKGELALPKPCLIRKVVLSRVNPAAQAGELTFTVRVEGRVYVPEHYYEVPKRVRLRMGAIYGALVGILFYMIWKMGESGVLSAAQSGHGGWWQ